MAIGRATENAFLYDNADISSVRESALKVQINYYRRRALALENELAYRRKLSMAVIHYLRKKCGDKEQGLTLEQMAVKYGILDAKGEFKR